MTNGRKTLTSVALLLAGSLLLLPDGAMAKKPRKALRAKIAGGLFKSNQPGLPAGALLFNNGGWTFNGAQRKGLKSFSTLTLACEAPGGITVGSTYNCGGAFLTTPLRPGASPRGWTTDEGIQATVTKFDGASIAGTFSGTFENVGDTNPPGDGPATVTKGVFALPLFQ